MRGSPDGKEQSVEEKVTFESEGLKLAGVLHLPDGRGPHERRPAFLVLHGFGSSKDSGGGTPTAKLFAELRPPGLRFHKRGCGRNGGTRRRGVFPRQGEATENALA